MTAVLQTIRFPFLALMLALGLGLAACEEQGPAEEAGEAVDEAGEEAGDAIEDAGDAVEDAGDQQ